MNDYIEEINNIYEPLSSAEQNHFYNEMKEGDTQARATIIHSCLPMVFNIAQKFHLNNKHIDIEDMVQQGNIALIKAVDKWDISKASITTVATRYITNSLVDMIKDSRYNIKSKFDLTRQACEDISKIKKTESTDVKEITKQTGLKPKRINLLLSILSGKRIDYSVMNVKLHKSGDLDETIAGCVADLIQLTNEHISEEKDRTIFLNWITFINKNNKTRMVAEKCKCSSQEVSDSVKTTKRKLREIMRG
jgi:RNA polymerase sigma factor (sigma-70 family)